MQTLFNDGSPEGYKEPPVAKKTYREKVDSREEKIRPQYNQSREEDSIQLVDQSRKKLFKKTRKRKAKLQKWRDKTHLVEMMYHKARGENEMLQAALEESERQNKEIHEHAVKMARSAYGRPRRQGIRL